MFAFKLIPVALAVVALTLAAPEAARAAQKDCPKENVEKSGTFQAEITTVGFIVGVRWGEGTITLNDGSQHKIHLEGAKLLEYGAEKVTLTGEVLNLKKLEDFAAWLIHSEPIFLPKGSQKRNVGS